MLDIDPWQRPGRDALPPQVSDAFEGALAKMESLGAIIADPAEVPCAVDGTLWPCAQSQTGPRALVVKAECNAYLTKYLQELGGEGGCRSVADIIQ